MLKDTEIKGEGNNLDFGARMYDPRLGRWLSLDPLAKSYPDLTPYNFCANSPIMFIDPDGKKINWFLSIGALKVRKLLIEVGMRDAWKEMVKSSTKITIILAKEVLVQRDPNNNSLGLLEGVTETDTKNWQVKVKSGHSTSGFQTATMIVSMGVYNLKSDILNFYGVSEWKNLTQAQKLAGIAEFSGNYKFIDSQQNIVPVNGNTTFSVGGYGPNSPYYQYSIMDPLPNETKDEYLARVAGHEGDHSVNASKNVKKSNPIYQKGKLDSFNETKFDDLQETEGYQKEGYIIEKEQNRRLGDNKTEK